MAQAKSIDEEIPLEELHQMVNQMYQCKLYKRLMNLLMLQNEKEIADSLNAKMDQEIEQMEEETKALLSQIEVHEEKKIEARRNESFWFMMRDFLGLKLVDFHRDLLNNKKYHVRFCLCSNYFVKIVVI